MGSTIVVPEEVRASFTGELIGPADPAYEQARRVHNGLINKRPALIARCRTVPDIAARFGCVVGLSDHTHGIAVSVAAVALGARIIEKHVTLSRADGGPDAAFSLEPGELESLVEGCRTAFEALGKADYARAPSEKGNMVSRRSLYVVQDIAAGQPFTPENVRSIRPGFGLAPKHLPDVLGKRAARSIARGTPLALEDVAAEASTPASGKRKP